ncbi:MAG: type II secretion system protein GspN [Myxococcales bacterium]|nr:type II secretion system protein GspN [Myxococcales bacterium]
MTPRRKTALWIAGTVAWALALYLFFVYRTFPYDRVEGLIADRIARAVPALDVQFMGFRPSWLTGVRVDRLVVHRRRTPPPGFTSRRAPGAPGASPDAPSADAPSAPLLAMRDVTARVRLLDLARGRIGVGVDGEASGGDVDAHVAIGRRGGRKIHLHLRDVDIAKYPYLKEELGATVEGLANLDLDLDMLSDNVAEWSGGGKVDIRNAKLVEVTAGEVPIPPFTFKTVSAELEVKDGKAVIKRSHVQGQEISDGQVTGEITLRPALDRSPMDLTAKFKLSPGLEQQWGSIISGQLRRKDAEGYYSVYVRGTLFAPRVIR